MTTRRHFEGHAGDQTGGKLLVVDDNEMNRDMLSRRLAKRGHTVRVAADGTRALEMIEAEDFDLVLLDIMMPGIDGYEVLERVRERYDSGELPVIMATAKDQSDDIVQALKLGANDYVTKPIDFPVVRARVRTQLDLKRSRDALAAAHGRMKRDLEAAAMIQQAALPPADVQHPGLRVSWRYVPCDELAGDTLNIIPLDDRHVGLYVLDVSGHGVPSALLSVTLSRLLSGEPTSLLWKGDEGSPERRISSPAEVTADLADRFPLDMETRQYFTLLYAVLDLSEGELRYASAAHVPLLRLREGAATESHDSTGPAIGLVIPGVMSAEFEEGSLSLQSGDRLYLYSDGIPEATSPEDEEYGEERLIQTLEGLRSVSLEDGVNSLLDDLRAWCGDRGFDDDVSILAVELE
jgi:sigma-B regulation protein RsbU (phosphoserine phosphatase)